MNRGLKIFKDMPDYLRKEGIGLEIRGPEVQYSLGVTLFYWKFLFLHSKASDANIGITGRAWLILTWLIRSST